MKDRLTAYIGTFVNELVAAGVEHIVISPGSRSTPIALMAAKHPQLKLWMNIDERSAGFFALGLAKASHTPVALLCTSGTAAANYYPAIIEAFYGRVPLIVLTADRPHELREVGAPQTIDQVKLYGDHVKWFIDMPLPEQQPMLLKYVAMTASRAVATAQLSPQGPVHLNFPFREPLLPDDAYTFGEETSLTAFKRHMSRANITVHAGKRQPDDHMLCDIAALLIPQCKGLIICGPLGDQGADRDFAAAVTALASQLNYPIIADPLSQLRTGHHEQSWIIDCYDAFLRDETLASALAPDVIIRFGAMPVSKPLQLFVERQEQAMHIVVDEGAGWRDPTLLTTDMLYVDPIAFCEQLGAMIARKGLAEKRKDQDELALTGQGEWADLANRADQTDRIEQVVENERLQTWGNLWRYINEATGEIIEQQVSEYDALFEGRLFIELQRLLPEDTVLFIGNSMPIRDLDTFYRKHEKRMAVLANRGVNGIDGIVSTALGVSATGQRTVLVCGDLTFFHDLNGLLAAKQYGLDMTIIVINNDGGGIFSFLPQAERREHFEALFGTPTGLDYEHVVHMYGGSFVRIDDWAAFRDAFKEAMQSSGLQVIEVPTERQSNVDMHRRIWQRVSKGLTE